MPVTLVRAQPEEIPGGKPTLAACSAFFAAFFSAQRFQDRVEMNHLLETVGAIAAMNLQTGLHPFGDLRLVPLAVGTVIQSFVMSQLKPVALAEVSDKVFPVPKMFGHQRRGQMPSLGLQPSEERLLLLRRELQPGFYRLAPFGIRQPALGNHAAQSGYRAVGEQAGPLE